MSHCPGCGRTDMAGITHVCPPLTACLRCGSHVGAGVTHVCPAPSTTSVIVPGAVVSFPIVTEPREGVA